MKIVERPEIKGTQRLYLVEVVQGLVVTMGHVLKNLFNPQRMPVIFYPEQKKELPPTERGRHRLMKREDDYVGRPLLRRPAFHESDRPRLVGLRAVDPAAKFLGGAQITTRSDLNHPCGFITSSTYSPALHEWIGLALVARSIPEGEELVARDPVRDGDTAVRVASPVHYDPRGERMRQ